MKCDRCSRLLSEYIDGRLSVEDSAEIAAHLESCADCRVLDQELRATVAILGGLDAKAPPADLAQSIAARLERSMLLDGPPVAPRRSRLSPWPLAGAGLAAAALVLAGFYVIIEPRLGPPAPGAPETAFATGSDAETIAPAAGAAIVDGGSGGWGHICAGAAILDSAAKAKGEALDIVFGDQVDSLEVMEGGGSLRETRIAEVGGSAAAPQPAVAGAADTVTSADRVVLNRLQRGVEERERRAESAPSHTLEWQREPEGEPHLSAQERSIAVEPQSFSYDSPAPSTGDRLAGAVALYTVVTAGDTIRPAFQLLAMLPGTNGQALPTGALTEEMVRLAAGAREVNVIELAGARSVLELEMAPAAADRLHASLVRLYAANAVEEQPYRRLPAIASTARRKDLAAGSGGSQSEAKAPAALQLGRPVNAAASVDGDAGGVAGAAYYGTDASRTPVTTGVADKVKVRFIFSRRAPAPTTAPAPPAATAAPAAAENAASAEVVEPEAAAKPEAGN